MNKELKLAYAAGFFDGEGSISITSRQRKNFNTEHRLWVAIGQKDGATLDWIKDLFGGRIYVVKRDGSFYWVVSNKNAYFFLKEIYPYLQYKKPQAELAFAFVEGYDFSKRSLLNKKELDRRQEIREKMKAIKKVIVKSQYAGSTTKRADPKGM